MKTTSICAVLFAFAFGSELRGENMNKALFVSEVISDLNRAQPSWTDGYEYTREFSKATNLVAEVQSLERGMSTNIVTSVCGEPDIKSKWRGKSSETPIRVKYVYYLRRKNSGSVNMKDQYLGFYFSESGELDSAIYPKGTRVFTVDF